MKPFISPRVLTESELKIECIQFDGWKAKYVHDISNATPDQVLWLGWRERAKFTPSAEAPQGKLMLTFLGGTNELVMVSYQDDEHRILKVVWQKKP